MIALNTSGFVAPIFLNHNGTKSLYTSSPTFMKALSSIVKSSAGDIVFNPSPVVKRYSDSILVSFFFVNLVSSVSGEYLLFSSEFIPYSRPCNHPLLSSSFLFKPYIGDTDCNFTPPSFEFFSKSFCAPSGDTNLCVFFTSVYLFVLSVNSTAYSKFAPLVASSAPSPNKAPLRTSFATPIPFPRACLPIVFGFPPPVCFRNLPISVPLSPYVSNVTGSVDFKSVNPSLPSNRVGIAFVGIPNLEFTLSLSPLIPPSIPSFESPFPIKPPSVPLPPLEVVISSTSDVERFAIRVASLP